MARPFEAGQRCRVCGGAVQYNSVALPNGQVICVTCHRQRLEAAIARGDKPETFGGFGGVQACDMCRRIVRLGGVELSDGRVFCLGCYRKGLFTLPEVEAVRNDVLGVMVGFGMGVKRPAQLVVVNAKQLAAAIGVAWKPTSGYDARVLGVYRVAGAHESLLVESGQPARFLVWTLAHECAHDWHDENNPAFWALSKPMKEGPAQWAADEVSERMQLAGVAGRELRRPDVYGTAAIPFVRLERQGGIDEVLAFARGVGRAYLARSGPHPQQGLGPGRTCPRASDLVADAEALAGAGHVFAAKTCYDFALAANPFALGARWRRFVLRLSNLFVPRRSQRREHGQ